MLDRTTPMLLGCACVVPEGGVVGEVELDVQWPDPWQMNELLP